VTLPNQRDLFDVPGDVAYFNTSNLSPLLHSVREAGERALTTRSRPWDITADDWFSDVEQLRERASRLMGADADGIALIPATSYGLASAAQNLPIASGQRILVLDEEYPSNYYTWKRHALRNDAELAVVRREPGQTWTDAVLDALDERVAIVSIPNVHWTDGAVVDLNELAPVIHSAGAAFVVDASQSLGAIPLEVDVLRPDAVVAVGYKWLLGPFSLGYLYLAEKHRDGVPLEENWINRDGSEDFARLVDYTDRYLPGARRFDVGQRTNFGLVPMAIAALDQLLAWGISAIADSLRVLTGGIADRVSALPAIEPPAADQRAPHILGLRIARNAGSSILRVLHDERVWASVRGSALRISPHLHTTPEDCDRLVEALGKAL
jgi:selenocysteine lyase/cysteine desulfurase